MVQTSPKSALTVGAHVADLVQVICLTTAGPHNAKFHTGQTLSMSVMLALLTIFFAWRKTLTGARPSLRRRGLPLPIGSHRRLRSYIRTPNSLT